MHLPICRRGAAAVGVILLLASLPARVASAGVVAPPVSSSPPAAETSSFSAPIAGTELVVTTGDAEPFWFPGVDDAALSQASLSSVPVRSQEGAGLIVPGTHEHPLIPLPPSAWTGMAGLLGLGAVKLLRNARRLLA